MENWRKQGIEVDDLHYWPTDDNIADILTKPKATFTSIGENSDWQNGPVCTRFDRSAWAASRDFVRSVPKEEKIQAKFSLSHSVAIRPSSISHSLLLSQENDGNVHKLFKLCVDVMEKYRDLPKVLGVIARVIRASSKDDRDSINDVLTPEYDINRINTKEKFTQYQYNTVRLNHLITLLT